MATAKYSPVSACILIALLAPMIPVSPALSGENCLNSRISLDASSAEKIYLHPEKILEDIGAFWRDDRAYWLTSLWHKDAGYPVPPFGWEAHLQNFAARTPEEREQSKALTMARDCSAAMPEFADYAKRHICSFLPGSEQDISSTIFLTTAIIPNAFQKDFDIVLNLGAIGGGPDEIFNTAVHELFHVGYYRNEPLRTETLLGNETIHDFIYSLQNEGMATYVAFLASGKYPSPAKDYSMLEDPSKVSEAVAAINSLAEKVENEPEETFRKELFETGVTKRALYIAGAHMARRINDALGREALVATMAEGPRSFISTYNKTVPDSDRIHQFEIAGELSLFQRLHRSVVDRDYGEARGIAERIRADIPSTAASPGHIFQISGQLALYRKEYGLALEIFSLYAGFRPDQPNPHAGLAEAYYAMGEKERALACCRKVIELAPGNARAHQMIATIENPK